MSAGKKAIALAGGVKSGLSTPGAGNGDVVARASLQGAPVTVSGSTLTLTEAAHHLKILEFTSACTVTLPNSLPVGFNCLIVQVGVGVVSLSAASGAALRQFDGLSNTAGQWSEVSLRVRANSGGSAAEYVASGVMA